MMTEYMGIHPVRRIRIQGDPNDVRGYRILVFDADTGKAIGNITRIVIILDVYGDNKAVVTYNKVNEHGKIMKEFEHNPVEETVTLDNPELDVTAIVEGATL